jgi:hypothetical protein
MNPPSAPRTPDSPPRIGWDLWPVSIIAFFALAILGCAGFIAFCACHPADLVAPDYYEQEVRYQGQIDRIQHAQQRAQLASVTYDPATKLITISVPPNQAQPNASGTIQLYRPSAANLDQHLKLEPNARGIQTIDARALLPGLWKVRLSWTADQQDYFIDQELVIGPKAS